MNIDAGVAFDACDVIDGDSRRRHGTSSSTKLDQARDGGVGEVGFTAAINSSVRAKAMSAGLGGQPGRWRSTLTISWTGTACRRKFRRISEGAALMDVCPFHIGPIKQAFGGDGVALEGTLP